MRIGLAVVAIVSAALCAVSDDGVIEVPLTYRAVDPAVDKSESYLRGSAYASFGAEPLPECVRLPEYAEKHSLLGDIVMGGSSPLAVLTVQSPDSPSYDRLLFDANDNGDVMDDPICDGVRSGAPDSRSGARFVVDSTYELDGKTLSYRYVFNVPFVDLGTPPPDDGSVMNIGLMVEMPCFYEGAFSYDGRKYRVALVDANTNREFGDVSKTVNAMSSSGYVSHLDGDLLFLSTSDSIGKEDRLYCGQYLVIGDKLFRTKYDVPAGRMTLTPAEQSGYPLRLGQKVDRMSLCTPTFSLVVMLVHPKKKVRIPRADYCLLDYLIARKDSEGDEWILRADGSGTLRVGEYPRKPDVKVGPKERGAFKIGEPYKAGVSLLSRQAMYGAPDAVDDSGYGYMIFRVEGRAGEVVSDVAARYDDKLKAILASPRQGRPKEPTYWVMSRGQMVNHGKLEYG